METEDINLNALPTYGFQFALSNLGSLRQSFIKITIISIVGGLFGFYGTYLLSQLVSQIDSITYDQITYFYIPVFICAYLAKELLEYLTRRDGEAFSTLAGNNFYRSFFEAFIKSEASVLSNVSKEDLFIATSRYIGRATSFLSGWVWDTSRKISQFIIILFILGSQSIYVCLGSLIYLLIFLMFALRLSKQFAPYAQAVAVKGQSASSQLTQSFLASAIIRRLRLEEFFLGKIRSRFEEQAKSVVSAQRFHAKRWLIQLNAFNFLYIGTLFLGIYQVKSGSLQLGFLLLIRYAFDRLWEILVFVIEKYVGLIQEKEECIILRNLLKPLSTQPTAVDLQKQISSFAQIELNDVSISLPDSKRKDSFLLHIPKLLIKSGERISIKAPSGSGKTTLLLSLMKLVPTTGSIYFDKETLQNISQAPSLVSYVSPSEPLFPLSLEENITLGRDFGSEIINPLLSGLGIDTFLGDRSVVLGQANVNLSLGQSQRIRLARALISKSPLLLLDEPFTGLDVESREMIKKFIANWCVGSTIIVASHDPEDRLMASRHLSIRDGVLVED